MTIHHTQVGSSNLTDFTALVNVSGELLKTVANGGHVNNDSGLDILFYADEALTTKLHWDIEQYSPIAGHLVAWVKIPAVSASVDTVIYMAYGDNTITTWQGGIAGSAWNSNYKRVYHFTEGTALVDVITDSDLVNSGAISDPGIVVDGMAFGGTSYLHGDDSDLPGATGARTTSLWFKMTSNVACELMGYGANAVGAPQRWGMYYDGTNMMVEIIVGSGAFAWTYDNNWHHLVATYSGGSLYDGLNLFLDGVRQSLTIADATPDTMLGGSSEFALGRVPEVFGELYFSGMLDEVRVMDVAEDEGQVMAEYNNITEPGTFLTLGSEF